MDDIRPRNVVFSSNDQCRFCPPSFTSPHCLSALETAKPMICCILETIFNMRQALLLYEPLKIFNVLYISLGDGKVPLWWENSSISWLCWKLLKSRHGMKLYTTTHIQMYTGKKWCEWYHVCSPVNSIVLMSTSWFWYYITVILHIVLYFM